MNNFSYHNPVRIEFGKGTIASLADLLDADARVMVCYGGGSIKKNGVYDQVMAALGERRAAEFGGIEPNPRYETLVRAVELARKEKIDFILAVGGGSVLDGVKFIAAATKFAGDEPWDILAKGAEVADALAQGCVLTLPATGSEMNGFSVISRDSTREKLAFGSPLVYPKFSILDPETTYTLPERQTRNGVIDAFVHVMEQYCTTDVNSPLQDRQAEAILLTLIDQGPKVLANPDDYDTRANIMWAATNALNGLIGCGVVQDWVTHMIGHEITALWGIDHAQTLAIVLPATLQRRRDAKRAKLLRYAQAVWGIERDDEDKRIDRAIEMTREFFASMGAALSLGECGVSDDPAQVADRMEARNARRDRQSEVTWEDIRAILEMCR